MERFLTEKDIAVFLGLSIPDTLKQLKNSGLKTVQKQGRLVYSRSEVINWISSDLSSLTGERLLKAEVSSGGQGGLDSEFCGITQLLSRGGIFFPERISTRSSVFRFLAQTACDLGAAYDSRELREQLEEREKVVSTALKCGAALIHPLDIGKLYLEHELLALMIPPHPVPFGEASGRLTSLFFLLLFPDPHRHVHILARLNRLLRSCEFVNNLLTAQNENEAIETFRVRELEVIGSGAGR